MPSAKSIAFIPLGVGLESDAADVVLSVGKALEVENGFFLRTGENARRYGGIALSKTKIGGGNIPPAWALAGHGDALVSLSLPGSSPINVWSPGANRWASGTIATEQRGPIRPRRTQIAGDGRNPTLTYLAGFYFSGWQTISSTGTVVHHQAAIDASTGEQIASRTVDSTIVGQVLGHVVVTAGASTAVFVRHSTVGISFDVWAISGGVPTYNVTTNVAVATGPQQPRFLDAIGDPAPLVRVVYTDGTNALGLDYNPSTFASTAWNLKDSVGAAVPVDGTLGWMLDVGFGGSGLLAVMTTSLAAGAKTQWNVPSSGVNRAAVTTYTLDAGAGTVRRITGFTRTADPNGEFTVAWTNGPPTLPSNVDFTKIVHRASGVITAASPFYRGLSLASKPWTYNGDYYALAAFLGSVTQATYYIVRIPGPTNLAFPAPLAIIAPGAAEWATSAGSFCPVASTGIVGQFVTGAAVGIRLAGGGISTAVIASDLITINHSALGGLDGLGNPTQAMGSLFVPGGVLAQYDGQTYAEAGFAYGPEALTLTANATPGGLTAASDYYWATVYAYPDGQGRLWRSRPSVTTKRTIGAETSQNVRSPTLRTLGRAGVIIEIYRGKAGVANFLQKVGQISNDHTVDSVTFVDSMSDATLDSQEPLYTNGGVLRNDTLPSALCVLAAKGRVFVVSADNPREIWPSNTIVPGQGLSFSEDMIIRVDDVYGDLTGIVDLDDKIILSKKSAIYAFNGDGPDVLNRGSFTDPQIVARGVGTINPRSLLSTRDGVLFQTAAVRPVIEMLDRSLSIARPDGVPIGAGVQRYPERIMASVLVAKQGQARFYTFTGRTLVLDLLSGMWTTFLGQATQGATLWNDQAVYTASDAFGAVSITREDDTGATWTDVGIAYTRKITTPWIAAAGIDGFEHLNAAQGLGQTVGDHSLNVSIAKGYSDTDIAGSKTYAMTVAGRPTWNWELPPRFRRAEAFKFTLTETCNTAGAKINGVALEIAVRRGLARRPGADRS